MNPDLSTLVVPVYGNSGTITELIAAIERIEHQIHGDLEVVFVVDGSPDDSRQRLAERLRESALDARLVDHSRNFGSFAAIFGLQRTIELIEQGARGELAAQNAV